MFKYSLAAFVATVESQKRNDVYLRKVTRSACLGRTRVKEFIGAGEKVRLETCDRNAKG